MTTSSLPVLGAALAGAALAAVVVSLTLVPGLTGPACRLNRPLRDTRRGERCQDSDQPLPTRLPLLLS